MNEEEKNQNEEINLLIKILDTYTSTKIINNEEEVLATKVLESKPLGEGLKYETCDILKYRNNMFSIEGVFYIKDLEGKILSSAEVSSNRIIQSHRDIATFFYNNFKPSFLKSFEYVSKD